MKVGTFDLDELVLAGVLTAKQRRAVELHARGFSYRRIAEALGVSRETVRDAARQGHANIAAHLAAAR